MHRELPNRPSLEHLKKQAKDLLDAHQRRDPEAFARIRASVPAFAKMSDDELARAPFALHDAQSAIAREHGLPSWQALRDAVSEKNAEPAPPDELLRALFPLHFPDTVAAALRSASAHRAEAATAASASLAGALPLVAMRDALFSPGAIGPIHVGRPSTKAAVEAALARTPPTVAVIAQRAAETEEVAAASLHPVGCEAFVHARIADGARAWVILEGLRWVALESVGIAPDGHPIAHVTPARRELGDAGEREALAASLRDRARELARAHPAAATVLAAIDGLGPEALADLVIANLSVPVADKARYAAEPRLGERLRIAAELVEGQLARRGA